jgi:hypothetical protein
MRYGYGLLVLAGWVACAYAVRYGLMEHTAWVGACAAAPERLPCQIRAGLGLANHWGVLPWAGLALAALSCAVKGNRGRGFAVAGLALAVPGLVLYTASLAGVAAMIAALRIVRQAAVAPRPPAQTPMPTLR